MAMVGEDLHYSRGCGLISEKAPNGLNPLGTLTNSFGLTIYSSTVLTMRITSLTEKNHMTRSLGHACSSYESTLLTLFKTEDAAFVQE